jgi:long-subunit fatty acid transport protein
LDFWHGKSLNELDSTAKDVNGIDMEIARLEFHDSVDREYSGLGGRVGALAHLGEYVTLGFTTVFPMNLEVYEFWRQGTFISFDDGERESDVDEDDIEYNIERPFEFSGGIAVKLLDKRLTLGTDFQFSDWTQTAYDPLPAEDISRDHFEELYDSTIQVRAGAEYHVSEIDTRLRVGYIHDPIPFQGKDIENDRNFLTVGVGKIFDKAIKVDVAYMRGSWEQSDGSLSENRTDHRIFMSAAYRY